MQVKLKLILIKRNFKLIILLLGLVIFLGIHCIPTFTKFRTSLIARFGLFTYKITYSLIAVVGLFLIALGYYIASFFPMVLYNPPIGLRHLMLLLMLPVFVLFFSSFGSGFIKRAVKHPMLLAIKIWAFSHLLVNGELASILLFGSFLVWAIYDRISFKRRDAIKEVPPSDNNLPNIRVDVAAIVAGLTLYVLVVWKLHFWIFGVAVI